MGGTTAAPRKEVSTYNLVFAAPLGGQLPMSTHPYPQTPLEAVGIWGSHNQQIVDMVTVADVMTPEPTTVAPEDSLRLARDRMAEGGFRRLPVVQCGRLVGIVTDRDLRRATNSPFVLRERWYDDLILDQVKVWGAMTANLVTVASDDLLVVAAQLMRDHRIGGLPVVDQMCSPEDNQDTLDAQGIYDAQAQQHECQLTGIITETDLLDYLIQLLLNQVE